MLSKQNYLSVNSVAFSNERLNAQQKQQKYLQYTQRYKRRLNQDKVTPIPKKNNKTNNDRQMVLYKQPKALQQRQQKFKFSDCLLRYAQAAINPFANITDLPCIPDTITAPSYKFRTLIDVQMAVGTEGTGWAVMNPNTMSINNAGNTATQSDFPLVVTESTYGDIDYNWNGTNVGVEVTGYNSNSQYEFNTIAPGAIRLVAAGIESQYTGQLLNQSGTVSVLQWDGLRPFPNPISIGDIRKNQRTQTCATSRDARCYVRYEPVSSANFDYQPPIFSLSTSANRYPYPLGIFVSGATPGVTFRIRAVAFFELQLTNAPVTPSESDPIGFSALQSARTAVLPTTEPQQDLFTILKKAAINVGKSITGFAPMIGTAIGSALGNPTAGFAVGTATKSLIEEMFN